MRVRLPPDNRAYRVEGVGVTALAGAKALDGPIRLDPICPAIPVGCHAGWIICSSCSSRLRCCSFICLDLFGVPLEGGLFVDVVVADAQGDYVVLLLHGISDLLLVAEGQSQCSSVQVSRTFDITAGHDARRDPITLLDSRPAERRGTLLLPYWPSAAGSGLVFQQRGELASCRTVVPSHRAWSWYSGRRTPTSIGHARP